MKKFFFTLMLGLLSFMAISYSTPVEAQAADDDVGHYASVQVDMPVVDSTLTVVSLNDYRCVFAAKVTFSPYEQGQYATQMDYLPKKVNRLLHIDPGNYIV